MTATSAHNSAAHPCRKTLPLRTAATFPDSGGACAGSLLTVVFARARSPRRCEVTLPAVQHDQLRVRQIADQQRPGRVAGEGAVAAVGDRPARVACTHRSVMPAGDE